MMRMARKRTDSPDTARRKRPQGFDSAFLPNAMAVAGSAFSGHLHGSSIDGVAYGFVWSDDLHKNIPSVSLLAQNGNELKKAFDEFNGWSQVTDPDSVALTFVFLKDGGYVLAIAPEYWRLRQRCLGFDRAHQAIAFSATWFKRMDSIHPELRQLREYCSQPLAPFSFGGVTYIGPRNVLNPHTLPNVLPIAGLVPLLKFEATFADEDNVVPHSLEWLAVRVPLGKAVGARTPPAPELNEIAARRRSTIACHFPVTIDRMHRRGDIASLMRQLVPEVWPWQIEQALCNLVVSSEIGKDRHYRGLKAREVAAHVTQALQSRCELADGGATPTFTADDVRTQIVADGNALLRSLKKKKKRASLNAVQAALAAVRALDAEAVAQSACEGRTLG